jgi:ribosomal-protein-alanine N-acetyltransferase
MSDKIEELIIERMSLEDLEDVVQIEKDSFSDPWNLDCFLSDLKNPLAVPLVAKFDDQVVGYTCLWVILDELQIGNIAVEKDFRKKGIGKKLMDQILEEAENNGCHRITLDVRESNLDAIELYKKFGFQKIGKRKNYYRYPTEDALVMQKLI